MVVQESVSIDDDEAITVATDGGRSAVHDEDVSATEQENQNLNNVNEGGVEDSIDDSVGSEPEMINNLNDEGVDEAEMDGGGDDFDPGGIGVGVPIPEAIPAESGFVQQFSNRFRELLNQDQPNFNEL